MRRTREEPLSSRVDFYQKCEATVDVLMEQKPAEAEHVQVRLSAIKKHCRARTNATHALHDQPIVPATEHDAMLQQFKLMLLSQLTGAHILAGSTNRSSWQGVTDLRQLQDIPLEIVHATLHRNGYEELPFDGNTEAAIGFTRDGIATTPLTCRRHDLPGTNLTLASYLTTMQKEGFRPTDPRVADSVRQMSYAVIVDYFVSSALIQSNRPFVFPANLDAGSLPEGVTAFGGACFRSSNRADASIIEPFKEDKRVGHFAAISGAGFCQLIEVGTDGVTFTKHANVFTGPANLFGAEKSVLWHTLENGGFDRDRTFLVMEHAEGSIYGMALPTEDQKADLDAPGVPGYLKRNQGWVDRGRDRLGSKDFERVVSGEVSRHIPRQGQEVFDLAEAISLEALHCGIDESRMIIDRTCPTTDIWNTHWSNTVEGAFYPVKFVAPDAPQDKKDLMLHPRNGYFTHVRRRG